MLKPIVVKNITGLKKHKAVYQLRRSNGTPFGFIAIHNDTLGPSVGGTRMFPYPSSKIALKDVLRLSNAMSYKCALAGVKYGGGKAAIIGDPMFDKTPSLLEDYALNILQLDGTFYTGEDVGILEKDVQEMLKIAPNFIGKRGMAGDPSPYAALSTYHSMKAATEILTGQPLLTGVRVGIKGVGKVGSELARLLIKDGAEVFVSDIDEIAINKLRQQFSSIKVVDNKDITTMDIDIFAPCAMGDDITADNVELVKAKIVCGAANNQLENFKIGDVLYKNKKLFIVDYVANCGGLINVVDELEEGGYNHSRVLARINKVKDTIHMLYELSLSQEMPMHRIANQLAESIIQNKN